MQQCVCGFKSHISVGWWFLPAELKAGGGGWGMETELQLQSGLSSLWLSAPSDSCPLCLWLHPSLLTLSPGVPGHGQPWKGSLVFHVQSPAACVQLHCTLNMKLKFLPL